MSNSWYFVKLSESGRIERQKCTMIVITRLTPLLKKRREGKKKKRAFDTITFYEEVAVFSHNYSGAIVKSIMQCNFFQCCTKSLSVQYSDCIPFMFKVLFEIRFFNA